MSLCKGPACYREVLAKDLCAAHYKQMKRHGRLAVIEEVGLIEDRFWINIEKRDGCWIWKGPVDKGYGRLYHNGKSYQAHRWSYEQHKHVSLTKKDTLDHLCRNTLCCNPEHLEKVALIENIERQHLYHALVSENDRLRAFITTLGYDPDNLKGNNKMNKEDDDYNFSQTHASCPICGDPAADGDQIDWWPCCSPKCLLDYETDPE